MPSTIYAGSVECAPFLFRKILHILDLLSPDESGPWVEGSALGLNIMTHDSKKNCHPNKKSIFQKPWNQNIIKYTGIFIQNIFMENKHLVYWTQYAPPPPHRPPHQATQLLVPEKWASGGKCLGQGGISCQNNRALSDAEMRHMCNGKNPKVLIEKHVQNYKHV